MRSLTPADVARRPLPGASVPSSVAVSPSGRWLTMLAAPPGSLDQQLVAVDIASGERHVVPAPGQPLAERELSLEERLRRERARELAVGVTRVAWAADTDRLLLPMSDGLWVLDGPLAEPARIVAATDHEGPLLDARISADGAQLGYVAGGDVYVVDVDGGAPVRVTAGPADRTRGLAEFIAQEELHRSEGFWFSPDGASVAFCEVDETHVPIYRIVHQGSDAVGPSAQEDHAYPFAGAANAHVRVGVVPADGSGANAPTWLDLDATGIGADRYVARVGWTPDGAVWTQLLDRDQQRLDLVRHDPSTGAGELLLTERSDVWINVHDDLRFLDDGRFLWASERTGHRHLELRDPSGTLATPLTEGPWTVTSVVAHDEDRVWFTATTETGRERQLFEVAFDRPGPPRRLTDAPGVHSSVARRPGGPWADTVSAPDRPPRVVLHADDAATTVHDGADDPRVAQLGLEPPAELAVPAPDGTPLHGLLYAPAGDGPHPLVVWTYGGPGAQLVTRSWGVTVALRAQYLRQQGFAVAVVDGRGSANRGLAFEGALRRRMGTVEVDDQVALVRHLVDAGIADPARVGIYGWSYGGYLSLMCLARRPDVFAAACAGAPVTSWDGYDTCYTERYMGTPQANPEGYADGAVMTHVEGLRGRALLLVHGLIDENVHFRHTARLLNALLGADIDHELLLYPDERHVPRHERDRVSMERRIADFFADALR